MDPTATTLLELRDAIAQKRLSATEVTAAYLHRIDALNGTLNAYREVVGDYARQRAAAVDHGEVSGPLAGVPIAIKDCMCHTEGTTACCSKMLEHYRSPMTATAVRRLEEAGAIILGKTNMDEFAMGSSTENSAFGVTRNPWDTSRVPGGSSGGSSAAMAADLAAATLGSDTGGSIRQPAALCGVVGFKPTYGRISRHGLVAFASSLDQIGTFSRTVADTALLYQIMAGEDPLDSTSAHLPVEADVTEVDAPATDGPLRIGLARQYMVEGANDPAATRALEQAIERYREAGATFVEVDLPHTEYGIPCYYIVATAECSSNLARYDGIHFGHRSRQASDLAKLYTRSRAEGFGMEVQRRIMLGTYALSSGYAAAYYERALKTRRLIKQDFDQAFTQADVILCPTTTGPAFRIGEKSNDPLAMYLNDIYTVNANLAGVPAISLPAGTTEEKDPPLPVAVQLIGPAFQERRLLRAARVYERANPYGLLRPRLGCPPFPRQDFSDARKPPVPGH